jgi:4-amino-4-deoxy-L-arabinose transferase-like glycosyltransferase
MYGHDQDLAGWIVKDIVIDGHLRLIGQETSTQGIFIGGFFYYLQIPFYLLFGMDPIGVTLMGGILGTLYILGIYLIFLKVFSKRVATIGALIYAFSYYFIFNDREIVPTQPVIFWGFTLFWSLTEIIKGNIKKGLAACAILFSLVWHMNFALILPAPLVFVALALTRKKIKLADVLLPIGIFFVFSVPLIYFEFHQSFIQTHALKASFTSNQHDIISGLDKIVRTYHLISKNVYSIFLPSTEFLKYEFITFIFIYVLSSFLKLSSSYSI